MKIIVTSFLNLLRVLPPKARIKLWLSFPLMVFAGLLETVSFAVIYLYMRALVKAETQDKDFLTLLDTQIPTEQFAWIAGLALIAIFIVKNTLSIFIRQYSNKLILDFAENATLDYINAYLDLPYEETLHHENSQRQEKITNVWRTYVSSYSPVLKILTDCIVMGVILSALIYTQPVLTLGIFTTLGLLNVSILFATNKINHRLAQARHSLNLDGKRIIQEIFRNFKHIKLTNTKTFFVNGYKTLQTEFKSTTLISHTTQTLSTNVNEVFLCSALIFAILYHHITGLPLTESLPLLVFCAFAGLKIATLITRIIIGYQSICQYYSDQIEIVEDLTNLPKNTAAAPKAIDKGGAVSKAYISINNISYSYPNAEKHALKNITIDVNQNDFIGITGHSGSGKSTLTLLLMGLITPEEGSVTHNETYIYDDLSAWYKKIGYFSNDIRLSSKSILENIAFGIEYKNIDREKAWIALEKSGLAGFVKSLPHGIDEKLLDLGANISEGERQRLCLARIFYDQPEILILDEATSSIDVKTEKKIVDSILTHTKDCTLIMITHRLQNLQNADQIFLIEDGSIKDSGTFKQLKKYSDYFKTGS